MAKAQKTLVIGSTGHQHVTCVEWISLSRVNVVDFDYVIISTGMLTEKFLKSVPHDFFDKLRTDLSRVLTSDGRVTVIANAYFTAENKKRYISNYEWSPIAFGTTAESGDTVSITGHEFQKYLGHLKHWTFYFFLEKQWLTRALADQCGPFEQFTYNYIEVPLALNRYNKTLAVTYHINAVPKYVGIGRPLSINLTVLPALNDLDTRTTINLLLEELLSLAQLTLPPAWSESVPMPGIGECDASMALKNEEIARLQREVTDIETKKASLLKYKKLLYASGHELEEIFADALAICGGEIAAAKYSQEEFILRYNDNQYLVECKGVGKSIALTHLRQLMDYTLKYEEDEGYAGKGILLGNAWKDDAPEERGTNDKPIFPQNVAERAAAVGVALLNSIDFYRAFCRVLAGELQGKILLDRVTGSIGLVTFDNL